MRVNISKISSRVEILLSKMLDVHYPLLNKNIRFLNLIFILIVLNSLFLRSFLLGSKLIHDLILKESLITKYLNRSYLHQSINIKSKTHLKIHYVVQNWWIKVSSPWSRVLP